MTSVLGPSSKRSTTGRGGVQAAVTRELTRRIQTRSVCHMGWCGAAYDVALAPHCPLGPIALAASLQIAFSVPNFLIQEQSMGIHYNQRCDLLEYVMDPEPFRFQEGYAVAGSRPGLGVDIDENAVRRAAETGHRWRNPVWRGADGAFTEW